MFVLGNRETTSPIVPPNRVRHLFKQWEYTKCLRDLSPSVFPPHSSPPPCRFSSPVLNWTIAMFSLGVGPWTGVATRQEVETWVLCCKPIVSVLLSVLFMCRAVLCFLCVFLYFHFALLFFSLLFGHSFICGALTRLLCIFALFSTSGLCPASNDTKGWTCLPPEPDIWLVCWLRF